MLLPNLLQPSLSRQHTVHHSLCAVTQCTADITLKTAHCQPITLCCYPVYCNHQSQDRTKSNNHFILLHSVGRPSLSRQHTVNPSLCAVTQCTAAINLKTVHGQPITLCAVTNCIAAITLKTAHGQPITLCRYPVYCSHYFQDSTRSTHNFVLLPSVLKPSLSRQHTVNPSLCAVTQCTAVINLKTAHSQPITLCSFPVYCSNHSQDSTRSANHSVLLPSALKPSISRQRRSTHHKLCRYPVYCSNHTQDSTRSTYHTLCCCPV